MGFHKDKGRVFESAGIGAGGGGLLGEDGGSGGAAEHEVVHLVELLVGKNNVGAILHVWLESGVNKGHGRPMTSRTYPRCFAFFFILSKRAISR